jgi:hypothetical protein
LICSHEGFWVFRALFLGYDVERSLNVFRRHFNLIFHVDRTSGNPVYELSCWDVKWEEALHCFNGIDYIINWSFFGVCYAQKLFTVWRQLKYSKEFGEKFINPTFQFCIGVHCRSQCPRGLTRRFAAARLLRL